MNYKKYYSTFTFKLTEHKKEIEKKYNTNIINPFKGCYINSASKLIYMHIDKCASTSISTTLSEKYFIACDIFKDKEELLLQNLISKDYKFFAVIRDPYSRWISGLSEFITRFKATEKYIISQVSNHKYIFDEHTIPQHCSLEICYKNNIEINYLRLDNRLEEKINDLIDGPDKISLNKLRKSNPLIKLKCQNIFEKYIKPNPDEFNNLYKVDFDLYSKSI